jgi:hypothetical protein
MRFVDPAPVALDTPMDTPKGFAVTPGESDVQHGSDAPDASSWSIDRTKPGWAAAWGPAFRQDNWAVNAIRQLSNPVDNTSDGTNTWEAIKGSKYEPFWESFIDDRSATAVAARKAKLDQEIEDRKLLDGMPWYQSLPAQMAAGVLDAPTLLPGGAFVRGAKGGLSVAKSAMSVGAGAAVGSAVQEAGLQALTETRPASESAINIGASVLLGGLLGAGGSALMSKGEWAQAIKAIDNELQGTGATVADAKPIFEDVKAKLINAGRDEAEANTAAAVLAARYAARADRHSKHYGTNVIPLDLYRSEGVEVRGRTESPTRPLDERSDDLGNEGSRTSEGPLKDALTMAGSPMGVGSKLGDEYRAPAIVDWALANGRRDIAEVITERAERDAVRAKEAKPGVDPDSPKYERIAANLAKLADEAQGLADTLRAKFGDAPRLVAAQDGRPTEPSMPDGYVRLYRGENPDRNEVGGGYYTTDRSYAEGFGNLLYVDLPKSDAKFFKMPGLENIYNLTNYPAGPSKVNWRERTAPLVAAQDGRTFGQTDVKTPEFKAWFGESKVVDDAGEPRVLYHGTNAEFDAFDPSAKTKTAKYFGDGFYFSDRKFDAESYAKSGGRVVETYLSLQNPFIEGVSTFNGGRALEASGLRPDLIKDAYKKAGFDGVILQRGWVIAFDPKQIKSVNNRGTFDPNDPRILYQADRQAPTFYSAVGQAVDAAKIAKGSPDQWLGPRQERTYTTKDKKTGEEKTVTEVSYGGIIGNSPGIKPEEIEWLGLADWLKERGKTMPGQNRRPDPVTKEEILEYIRANAIEVKEVQKGGDAPPQLAQEHETLLTQRSDLAREYEALPSSDPRRDGLMDRMNEMNDRMREIENFEGPPTKFSQYTIPGGENYREMLLTLPPKTSPEGNAVANFAKAAREAYGERWTATAPETIRQQYDELIARQERLGREAAEAQNYRSAHWDEPNILAHVRFNDRVIDGKKTLFLEELQSDWHQAGKKKGYKKSDIPAAERGKLTAERDDLAGRVADLPRFRETAEDEANYVAWMVRVTELNDRLGESGGAVPDAPFKTTWPELILKRMIRYAAENGYEKIAWTPGEVQAARYDLSKHIDGLRYSRSVNDRTYTIDATLKGKSDRTRIAEAVAEKDLADHVGKELAEKIANSPDRQGEYTGLDLKVGGEGMKGFYDEILPATANKLVKKYGGRVRQEGVQTSDVSRFELSETSDGRWRVVDTSLNQGQGTFIGPIFKSGADAEKWLAENGHTNTTAHTLDLTPQLKEAAIEKGFPLFQGDGAAPRGQINLQSGKAIIDLFEKADRSTFMHESSHLWLDEIIRDAAQIPAIKADLDIVLKWMGVDDASKIGREQHEMFARAFERYLAEGKAPSEGLAKAFEQFKDWLLSIYKSLTEFNVNMNDDIRGVFDRMLATDAEIGARMAGEDIASQVARAAGAAAVEPPSLEGNQIAGKAASKVAKATAALNPLLRSLHSPSAVYRGITGKLFENPLYLKKNFDNVASDQAAETLMKEWNAGLANALRATADGYEEYWKRGGGGTRLVPGAAGRAGLMSRTEFNEMAGKAMRNLDESDIPEIAKVAKAWRANVFDPLKEAAIKARLLPADVTVETAASYFSRMWNRNKLVGAEGRFKGIVTDWVQSQFPKWLNDFDRSVERKLRPLHDEISYEEMAKLRRSEELKEIESGVPIAEGHFSESQIRNALRMVQGGAPKPKGVKTLTQFVADAGGLVDFGGEIAHRGITNKLRPGFVRNKPRLPGSSIGGWHMDDMARHAWENGYFPEHGSRPSPDEFLDALTDDFFKIRTVVRPDDAEAFRYADMIQQLENDLGRIGAAPGEKARFSTSDELKGMMKRVFAAMDADSDAKIKRAKDKLKEREIAARLEREERFLDDPKGLGAKIADEVFDTLTGKADEGVRPEFISIKARGPLKERTFNIPDNLVEEFLENDIEAVGRRYTRVMGADVEIAGKFGKVDMADQITEIRNEYRDLRAAAKTEKERKALDKSEESDINDLKFMRDILRGVSNESKVEHNYGRVVRVMNHLNYIRVMGEVALASLAESVRPAMVHGLTPYMQTMGRLGTGLNGIKASVREAQMAGQVSERMLGQRLATLSDIVDPYASRGPTERFVEQMSNVASRWNGIRMLTDMQKAIASVMTQDRILGNAGKFGKLKDGELAYMRHLGIDADMAERIAGYFKKHGEVVDGTKVANTEEWVRGLRGQELDAARVAVRAYRAAINKDVDSIITTRGVADVPLFANTPTGKAMLQFKSFALASHQRVLLRGLQEDQTRFLSGLIAMSTIGMMVTYFKAISGNREEKLADFATNPGWWISEGLDRSGVLSVPMELSNMFEKATGLNPIKAPIKAFDEGSRLSQKQQNRSGIGSFFGPSIGFGDDIITAAGVPKRVLSGDDVTQGQKNAAERLLPFNSYLGMRQMLRHVVNPQ